MTVAELQDILKDYPASDTIAIANYDGCLRTLVEVSNYKLVGVPDTINEYGQNCGSYCVIGLMMIAPEVAKKVNLRKV